MKFEFIDRFSNNTQISNFTSIHSVGAELFTAYRQTDRQTEFTDRTVAFRNFAEAPRNLRMSRRMLYLSGTYRSFATKESQLKMCDFSWGILKGLKCYNFLWVQSRQNCFPAASFANYVMTLYLLKVHLQTFLSLPLTQKCQILSCDTLVANERYVNCLNTHVLLLALCTK